MKIILIAAMAANRTIGYQNTIPWHIPDEQARFKKITMGSPLIMGRKTWQAIGHPLPGRENIVLTTRQGFKAPGAQVVHSLKEALHICTGCRQVFIIGGEQLYRLTLDIADTLILSILDYPVKGDAFFPEFSCPPFALDSEQRIEHEIAYTLRYYRRA